MELRTMLHAEIEDEIEYLKKLEVGSEQYKIGVDGVVKLADRIIEIDKSELDRMDKQTIQNNELTLKMRQLEEDSKDRKTKNRIAIGTFIGGCLLTVWGTLKTLTFDEKGGIVTSLMGKGFINHLNPRK